jgi:hypothetical protein
MYKSANAFNKISVNIIYKIGQVCISPVFFIGLCYKNVIFEAEGFVAFLN